MVPTTLPSGAESAPWCNPRSPSGAASTFRGRRRRIRPRAICELQGDEWKRSLRINFYGAYHAVIAVLPAMRARHSGHLVLISSMDARKGMPTDAPYVVAKAALTGFGDVLRQEMHAEGIQVTTVSRAGWIPPSSPTCAWPAISAKISPQRVAEVIVTAIRPPPSGRHLPSQACLLDLVQTLSPRWPIGSSAVFHLQGWEQDPSAHQGGRTRPPPDRGVANMSPLTRPPPPPVPPHPWLRSSAS